MAIPYPATLPAPSARLTGGTSVPTNRTEMDSGLIRQTSRFATQLRKWSVAWELTAEEFTAFKTFFGTTLENGALYFELDLPDGAETFETVNVRFVGGDYKSAYKNVNTFDVSAEVEQEIVQAIVEPTVAPVPLWFRPEITLVGNTTLDASQANALLKANPGTGNTYTVTVPEITDPSDQLPVGIKLLGAGTVTVQTDGETGGGGGGGDPRGDAGTLLVGLAGAEVVIVGGASQCTTDAAATLPAGKYNGIRTIENLCFGVTGSSGQRLVEVSAVADSARPTLDASLDFILDGTSGGRGLKTTTHPFTAAGDFLVGFVIRRHAPINTNVPIVALGDTPFVNQSYNFSRRSGVLGLTNNFNPPTNAGGTVPDYAGAFEYVTFARSGTNWKININGATVFNAGQLWSPGGTNRDPMIFGSPFSVSASVTVRAVFYGTDVSAQTPLDGILATLAAL